MLIRFWLFLLFAVAACFYNGSVSIDVASVHVQMPMVLAVVSVYTVIFVYDICALVCRAVVKLFTGKPHHERGIDSLQMALSSLLIKDTEAAMSYVKRAAKYLGNRPILSWLEGQIYLRTGKEKDAKAVFYKLIDDEKESSLGAYSLCHMDLASGDGKGALQSLDLIVNKNKHAYGMIFQALSLAITHKQFDVARKYLDMLHTTDYVRIIDAVMSYEEGVATGKNELLKRAFKLAPQLSVVALSYADALLAEDSKRAARKVLMKSFSLNPSIDVMQKCMQCIDDQSAKSQLKLAQEMKDEAPDSWIPYYVCAGIAEKEGMSILAFQNLYLAYQKANYDFIAERLLSIASALDDPKPEDALNVLGTTLHSRTVRFVWKCKECGMEIDHWSSTCKECDQIASYELVASDCQTNCKMLELL